MQLVLLGERIGSHGANTWATPGGHLEMGESIESCAAREVLEETGLEISAITQLGYTNDIFDATKHYITLYVTAESASQDATIMEVDKCTQWQWFDMTKLPSPLFKPMNNLLSNHDLMSKLHNLINKN
ncbi:nucleotide triphosphate diphosphatase NUDT15 [Psychrobium sp. nBUS_13]|uniref:nucleotide triphosphate diphosphatase NUDT15 n=1 Tax=Psychrobium sp. nBUS_13 TaxID=3395319 RepID=UPI003EBCBEC2